jgi:hypothetical protein
VGDRTRMEMGPSCQAVNTLDIQKYFNTCMEEEGRQHETPVRPRVAIVKLQTCPVLRLITILLMLLLLFIFTAACSNPFRGSERASDLIVSLGFPGKHLIIDNGNDYVWNHVTIRLNGSYSYTTSLLPRGASSIPLSEFRDEQGHPFVPDSMTPHRVLLDVQEGFQGKPGHFEW